MPGPRAMEASREVAYVSVRWGSSGREGVEGVVVAAVVDGFVDRSASEEEAGW